MERLTQQNSTYYEKAIKQLQEYENTGLTPQEVELYVKCQGKLIDKELLKLKKENAELKSRLEKSVELPCKMVEIEDDNTSEINKTSKKKSKYCNGNCSLCEYFAYTGKCALHTGE